MCPRRRGYERFEPAFVDCKSICAHDGHTLAKTIVFLKRPQISSAFEVTAVHRGLTGELRGDVEALSKFLDICEGVPQFDLEFDGHQFLKCVLGGRSTSNSIPFSFGSLVAIDELTSMPGMATPKSD